MAPSLAYNGTERSETPHVAVAKRKTELGRSHAERRREAEARILEAAFGIVAERGVDQLTLAEAGEAAGYSRALAAHYFGNREALLGAVAEYAVETYSQRLSSMDVPRTGGLETVLLLIAFFIDDSRSWPKRLRAFYEVTNAALRWPSIAAVVARLNQASIGHYAGLIRTAQAQGEIRADLDPVAESVLIAASLRGIMGQWLTAPDAIDLDAVRDAYLAGLRRSWAPGR